MGIQVETTHANTMKKLNEDIFADPLEGSKNKVAQEIYA